MNKEAIIQQTACDYNMSYQEVEIIYNKYHDEDPLNFYFKIEEHFKIKNLK
jgi:hypothetical protein